MRFRSLFSSTVTAVVLASLLLSGGSSSLAAGIGTVQGATSDGSGNLIDITFDVQGSSETLPAEELIGSTLVLSTLTGNPWPTDANRFWTLNGAPEPTEAQALRSVGDKYMGTALQDCASTSQHDTLFDKPILPGPGPEIFIYHGGLNDPFVVLDENGSPALTIPNNIGNAISVSLSSQFKAWYLQNNGVYSVVGTFPHYDVQNWIVALDLDPSDIAAIGGLRFAGGSCDYVYEILGRQPVPKQPVPFGGSGVVASSGGTPSPDSIWVDVDRDGDLDIVNALGTLDWHENVGRDVQNWPVRTIDPADLYHNYLSYGDLDGDGDPDVLSAASFGEPYSWYENDGASPPGWTKQTLSALSSDAQFVRPVDLDADGDLDVVITDIGAVGPGDGNLAWLENDGAADPSWTRRPLGTSINVGASFGDFDGDGDVDVVSPTQGCAADVELYESDGGSPPAFTPRTVGTLDGGFLVSAGDIDADGDLDFAIPGSSCVQPSDSELVWFESDGAAVPSFTRHTVETGFVHGRISLRDLDLDGDLDIVTSVGQAGEAGRYYSNDGGSPPRWTGRVIPGQTGVSSFRTDTGDFDQDGDVDLLTATATDGVALLTENRTIHRSGIFPTKSVISNTADSAVSVFATDVDRDGDIDVLSASQLDDTIAWYDNDGGSTPSWTKRIIADDTDSAFFVSAGDVDGDGDIDALSASQPEDLVAWYENTSGSVEVVNPDFELLYKAGSTTVTAPLFPVLQYASGPSPIGMTASYTVTFSDSSTGSLVDMPGWQWSEVVGVTNVNPLVSPGRDMVLLINGAAFGGGTAGASITQVLSESLEQDTVYTLTADFGWRTDNSLATLPPVLELRAGGTLLTPIGSSSPALVQGGWVTYSRSYLVSDLGISGPLEIEIGLGPNTNGQQLNIDRVRLQKEGSVAPPGWIKRTISDTVDAAISVVPADMDGDGDLDALTAGNLDNTIAWYENDGASPPNWTENVITTDAVLARNAIAADVDGDGDPDVLSASDGDDTIAWYDNPTWTKRIITNTADRATGVFAADVDGDGDIDALSASIDDDTIAWYENDGDVPPSWIQRIITNTADGAYSVVAADLDADGDIDALSSSLNDDTVAWYENDGDSPPGWTKHLLTDTADRARAVFAADVDGDGDLDALSASEDDDTIAWYENRGGQFTNVAAECLSGSLVENQTVALASTRVRLNGRGGDSPARIVSTLVDLELAPSDLSTVIDTLRVYRDTGSGEFEADEDVLIETIDVATFDPDGGFYPIRFPAGDSNTIIAAEVTFFIAGDVTAGASTSGFTSLTVSNRVGDTLMNDANAFDTIRLSEEGGGTPASCSEVLPIEQEIVVDDFTDADDANAGDGVCATASATCTLRAAISEANAIPGTNRIALPAGTYALSIVADDNTNAGGDIDINDDLTLVGAGAGMTVIDGVLATNRVLNTNGPITVVIRDLSVTGGDTNGPGGGLFVDAGGTAELEGVSIEGNTAAGDGGGVAAGPSSLLQLVDSRVAGNTSEFGAGGGIHSTGTVNLVRSEVSGNVSDTGGGGVYSNSVLQSLSSTISSNSAVGSFGGGILADPSAFVALDNSTVAGNDAAGAGGGVMVNGGATLNSNSTIFADNVAGGASDCTGNLISGGYTLVKNTSGCSVTSLTPGTDLLDVDPFLSELGDYDGENLTHRLLIGSPAIDAGTCSGLGAERDQTGEPRPIDDPSVANAADGCDIGAHEARLGQTQTTIEIPIRWCGLRGAPSIEDPSLVGESSFNDVMRRRHETASDGIYKPKAGIVFRSGGNFIIEDYPLLEDPDCVEGPPGVFACEAGQRGDVVMDLATGNFSEFQNLVAECRRAWEVLDPDIQGITAVQINRFVDPAGNVLDIQGVGGRAPFGNASEQFVAGRLMVIDNFYRLPGNPEAPNPADTNERLFGHEMGHALSLLHGNGLDDDLDLFLDNDDEPDGEPRFDGPNLLQYRNGEELTELQALQMRIHALTTIPDAGAQVFSDSVADGVPLDQENSLILQFGYDALTELENSLILQFENSLLLQFENSLILQFENSLILQFENSQLLQFENSLILQFGMEYGGTTPTDESTFHMSLASLPWPAAIRPDTYYYFYLDLDTDDATGGYPADFANPSDPGNNFPGFDNVDGDPPVGEEFGVDLIIQVKLTSECPGGVCDSDAGLLAFDFNDLTQEYELVFSDPDPDLSAYGVGLYRDNGGQDPSLEDAPAGFTVRPSIPNSVLFDAGWGFQSGPSGPIPNTVRMEALTAIECSGRALNDDLNSEVIDCQCTDCNDCPDYPGCTGTTGTPKTLAGSRILTDNRAGEVTFEPPLLPRATVAPLLAEQGQLVTVSVLDLPTDVTGQVEVTMEGVVLGTVSTSLIDADGNVSLDVPLPADALGEKTLSAGITGFAPRATTVVTITPVLDFPDNDGDGDPDSTDPDDDNDGVDDTTEIGNGSDPFNPFNCGDSDLDTCDDCDGGSFNPADDGRDLDLDGLCNDGDTDDDNDGVPDTADSDPLNPDVCGDTDGDTCDDCSVGETFDPTDDGPDVDGDGLCDAGDPTATPVVGPITAPFDPQPLGTSITASAMFTDLDVNDTHTAEWDWGDGTTSPGTVTEGGGSGLVADSYTYTEPGVYRVGLTVSDDFESDSSEFQFVVIYDPTGGFVTGGGWIDSPPGAYVANPALVGQASFGFVSKYKRGATVPTGNTEFEFAVADLLFESTEYEWLVVAGPRAQFKGSGTINGLGNYGFFITAIDEKLTPSTDDDLFRIKIWDKDAGDAMVYDNQIGAADDEDPSIALGGGSIVIHRAN